MERPVITGWGMARGSRTVTNKELACIIAAYGGRDNLTTGDIIQHTGMVTRYWVDPQKGETTLTLALAASRQALEQAGISPEALDAIIMATVSPDYGNGIPASACLLQRELIGSSVLFQIPAFDMNAACSGFVYGLRLAKALIADGCRRILLVGSETLSHFTSKKDYRTAVLFGDGAGAVVVERSGQDHHGIIDVVWHANGNDTDLVIPAGGSRQPLTAELLADDKHMIQMDDKRVFGFAIAVCANVIEALMKRNDLTWPDVDWIVPHQANKRIIEAVARRLDVPLEKFIINIHQYGNTSSASIPIALAEAVNNGVIQRGDRVLLAAFGAGFTWGGCYLVWGR